jgi:hypothetical protein
MLEAVHIGSRLNEQTVTADTLCLIRHNVAFVPIVPFVTAAK